MEYHGKLYGKIGDKHFDTGKTSSDFDNYQHQLEKLEADKAELLEALENTKTAFRYFPERLYEIESLIQKHKQ